MMLSHEQFSLFPEDGYHVHQNAKWTNLPNGYYDQPQIQHDPLPGMEMSPEDHAAALGKTLADGIEALDHPLVDHVRGRGLLRGVVLTAPQAKAVEAAAREAGFLVNAAAPDVVRLAPPLIISTEQIDTFLAALPGILDTGASA